MEQNNPVAITDRPPAESIEGRYLSQTGPAVVFSLICLLGLLAICGLVLVLAIGPNLYCLQVVIVVTVFASLVSLLLPEHTEKEVAKWPIVVHLSGLFGYNEWGVIRFVPWNDMLEAWPRRIANLRYVVVRTSQFGYRLWIPEFLVEQSEFEALVLRLAPTANPLRRIYEHRATAVVAAPATHPDHDGSR